MRGLQIWQMAGKNSGMPSSDFHTAEAPAPATISGGGFFAAYRRRRQGLFAPYREGATPLPMARQTGRRTPDTDWTRSNEHLPTMRSAGNLRLPRQEHRRNDLVLQHPPARSVLGRRTARPEHIAATRPSRFCNLHAIQLAVNDPHLSLASTDLATCDGRSSLWTTEKHAC